MKVGVITLMTAFLLALPLAAFAGAPACDDTDSDGVCDTEAPIDNCIDTPNPAQGDLDSDGQGDVCDNCISVQNGPGGGPYPGKGGPNTGGLWGLDTPGLQCDTNWDGFGNACDADLNDNNAVQANDFTALFNPASAVFPPFVWVANTPGGTLTTPQAQEADQNCNNALQANDFSIYFNPAFIPFPPLMTGRSGIATGTPGCCPPHN